MWRGHTQLSSSPPNSPIDRGGTYASRMSRSVVEMNIRYDFPGSISEMPMDLPGRSFWAVLVSSPMRPSIAFARSIGSIVSFTTLITWPVTSRISSVMRAVMPRARISSGRVAARNPFVR